MIFGNQFISAIKHTPFDFNCVSNIRFMMCKNFSLTDPYCI